MKRANEADQFTIREVEFLCRQYIECRMSVAEETELEYILSRSGLTSPVIDETRRMMGLSRLVDLGSDAKLSYRPGVWKRFVSVAAGIAVVLGIGFFAMHEKIGNQDDYTCVAYIDGHLFKGDEALKYAEASHQRAEKIISEMQKISDAEINQCENIVNQINTQL